MGVEGVKTKLEELILEAFLICRLASAHGFDCACDVILEEKMEQGDGEVI